LWEKKKTRRKEEEEEGGRRNKYLWRRKTSVCQVCVCV
jgi:hypothetical protein